MDSTSLNGSEPDIINHSTADVTADSSTQTNTQEDDSSDAPRRPPALTRASTSALEKCWICLATKDEDPPSPPNPPTAWRHPCACSLRAHETCLLDWIADQEAPRSRSGGGGRSGPSPDKILCPQCRSEIKIQRPVDPIVQLCRRIDRNYSRLVLPGLATSVAGMIGAGCWMHGRAAVYYVFGPEQSRDIYHYARGASTAHTASYALIPLNLIFARTRFADFVLPSGTIFLLGTQLESGMEIDWTLWPPRPSTVFACLPAVRQLYNWTYEKAFGNLSRKWIKEVQPRREEGYEGQEGNIADILNQHEAEIADAAGDGDDGRVLLELEVNLGVEEDEEEDMPGVRTPPNQEGHEEGDRDRDRHHHHHHDHEHDHPARPGRVHQLLGDNELIDDTSSIGQLVIGSLLMPYVAAAAGEVLKATLPRSWISPITNSSNGRTGLFASKWGRSVVGGLTFVAVKDMLVLYCRWRLAESHKKRQVMNYDRARKEYVSAD